MEGRERSAGLKERLGVLAVGNRTLSDSALQSSRANGDLRNGTELLRRAHGRASERRRGGEETAATLAKAVTSLDLEGTSGGSGITLARAAKEDVAACQLGSGIDQLTRGSR